jgi:N-acetylmuramoyl-L-alanine amidase
MSYCSGRWKWVGGVVCSLLLAAGTANAVVRSTQGPSVRRLRVGIYPSYTRIVLETSTPLEWSLRRGDVHCLRLIIPQGRLAADIHPQSLRRGIVKSLRPLQRPGGVEVQLTCTQRDPQVRAFTLNDPDRIVVDILAAQSTDKEPTRAVGSPPAAPDVTIRDTRAAPSLPPERSDRNAAEQLTIVLDPGHGGHDTGAKGPAGLMEKDVVLDLALRLQQLLRERLGMRVILTRSADVFVPLPERVAIANRSKADFFISLHLNGSSKRGAVGSETYYFTREPSDNDARASAQRENLILDGDEAAGKDQNLLRITLADMAVTRDIKESSELAELILGSLDAILKLENRGVKSGPFYVLATAAMPAVLVESAFITNPKEERKLELGAYRQRIAEALFEAIGKYKVRYERRVGLRGSDASAGS